MMSANVSNEHDSTPAPPPVPNRLFALTETAILHVEGADARSYLHSQFSTDVQAYDPAASLLSSYSDPRGRLLAIPRLLPLGAEHIALVLPTEIIEPTAARLQKYALRARVAFRPGGDDWGSLGLCGEAAGDALAALGRSAPVQANACSIDGDGVAVVRLPDPRPRWSLHGPAERVERIASGLADALAEGDEVGWRRLDIEAGLPRIVTATSGRFVAQMVNLDRLAAIDFHKGCYPGQEVIARTRYLGRIKRRMFILEGSGETPPAPVDGVHREGSEQPVGEVVDAAPTEGGFVALAVLRLEAAESPLQVGAGVAHAQPPPYGLDEAD